MFLYKHGNVYVHMFNNPSRTSEHFDIRLWKDIVDIESEEESLEITEKGIPLDYGQWITLKGHAGKIRHHIKFVRSGRQLQEKLHLGDGTYCTITSPYWVVNIRKWFTNKNGVERPGQQGIGLKFKQWEKLEQLAATVDAACRGVAAADPGRGLEASRPAEPTPEPEPELELESTPEPTPEPTPEFEEEDDLRKRMI